MYVYVYPPLLSQSNVMAIKVCFIPASEFFTKAACIGEYIVMNISAFS